MLQQHRRMHKDAPDIKPAPSKSSQLKEEEEAGTSENTKSKKDGGERGSRAAAVRY